MLHTGKGSLVPSFRHTRPSRRMFKIQTGPRSHTTVYGDCRQMLPVQERTHAMCVTCCCAAASDIARREQLQGTRPFNDHAKHSNRHKRIAKLTMISIASFCVSFPLFLTSSKLVLMDARTLAAAAESMTFLPAPPSVFSGFVSLPARATISSLNLSSRSMSSRRWNNCRSGAPSRQPSTRQEHRLRLLCTYLGKICGMVALVRFDDLWQDDRHVRRTELRNFFASMPICVLPEMQPDQ
jgi:hypothetical protein